MHKIFAFIYLIFILICIGFGIQMFIERGVGIIDSENIIMSVLLFLGLALIGITHYKVSKTTQLSHHIVLLIFSSITTILTILLIFSYTFIPENGGLLTAMIGGFMLISLIITFFLSVSVLVKRT